MKNLTITCSGCGAPLEFSETERILTCEYCGNIFENPYYDEEVEIEGANAEVEAYLQEMSRTCRVAGHSFSHGTPMTYGKHYDAARIYFRIPPETRIYMVYDATYACDCTDGIAFTNEGIYYHEKTKGNGLVTWTGFAASTFMPTKKGLFINSLFFPSTRVTADELYAVLTELQAYINQSQTAEPKEKWTGTMEELLAKVCGEYAIGASDLSLSSTPITSGKHHDRARKYFHIPDADRIYLIYDSTLLGSCKKGFAMTNNGIYINDDREAFLTWDTFKEADINPSEGLHINDILFTTATETRNALYTLLADIQSQM